METARLKSEVNDLSVDITKKAEKQIGLISELQNVPELLQRPTINQQHSFSNRVSPLIMEHLAPLAYPRVLS